MVAIYLRNVLLNIASLVAAIAFVLMLPRAIGVIMEAPLDGASWPFYLSVLLFVVLLTLAGLAIAWNLIVLKRRHRELWSEEPLNPGEPGVITLIDQKRFLIRVRFLTTIRFLRPIWRTRSH